MGMELEKLIQVNCNWNNNVAYKTNVKKSFFLTFEDFKMNLWIGVVLLLLGVSYSQGKRVQLDSNILVHIYFVKYIFAIDLFQY